MNPEDKELLLSARLSISAKSYLGQCSLVPVASGSWLSFVPIAQSLPPSQLSKGHADELLATTKVPDARLRIVELDQTGQSFAVHKIENLRQDEAVGIHAEACLDRLQNSNA